jgi:hypothetical protein
MTTNLDLIKDRLIADATLLGSLDVTGGNHYSGIAKGGVWTRKLKRLSPGATPQAFADTTDDQTLIIRPSIVLLDRGDKPHRQRAAIPGAYNQSVWIYFYGPATQAGKDAIASMRQRVYELIDHDASGWTFQTAGGPVAFVQLVDRNGTHDSETFKEAVEDFQRYQVTSRYANLV